jgi:hypothetical protein
MFIDEPGVKGGNWGIREWELSPCHNRHMRTAVLNSL